MWFPCQESFYTSINIDHLLSSSIIVIVTLTELPIITLLGSKDGLMESVKYSSSSTILSSFIETLNTMSVIPAGNTILNGPEA